MSIKCRCNKEQYNEMFSILHCLNVFAPPVAEWQRSKQEDGKCQVQTPVALINLDIQSFLWFGSETRVNTG